MSKKLIILFVGIFSFYGCSSTEKVSSPADTKQKEKKTKTKPKKSIDFSALKNPPEDWHRMDKQIDQFAGISSEHAYNSILKNKSPKKEIVVAVIDGGIDIDHEDLQKHIWENKDEVPNNNKDDDNNGYTDDVHGWNFIGGANGKNVDNDTFEVTRIYARLHPKFEDADTTVLNAKQRGQYKLYQKVKDEYEYQINRQLKQYNNISSLEQSKKQADNVLSNYFSGSYSYKEVQELQPQDRRLGFAKNVMSYVMENDLDSTAIADQKKQVYEFAKYGYNPGFNPRTTVNDNYEDKSERYYGNADVSGPDPTHGTHVAGIIGAVRNNGIGLNGIANKVRIMPVRAVPDGDERDKDIANAIRYAVDNGANIINMSFGKSYSPYKEVVDQAVRYADRKGVLMVHAAGNSSEDTDKKANYPTDTYGDYFKGTNQASRWLSIGASSWKPNTAMVGNFSNYGQQRVDLFAPGADIYSSVPDNKYERFDGTSMAAPVVSGSAALLMSYYPDLKPNEIQSVILENVTKYDDQKVEKPHKADQEPSYVPFKNLSVTGGILNIFKALKAAKGLSEQ